MKKEICFFEPDEEFAQRQIDYWLGHGLGDYRIRYYSDARKWLADYESIASDLWILDSSIREDVVRVPLGVVLWWTDKEEDSGMIFKYRSAAVLLHTIKGYLETERDVSASKIISLYSPVKRCLQTTFGITLSHLLSAHKRILYLNLEGYSGMEHIFSGTHTKDISDFIYYINQHINQTSNDIPLIIQKYIYRLGEVDMIPPVLNPSNLQDITEEMWLNSLRILQSSGLYDYILLDISDFIYGSFAVLRESQVIFSSTKSNFEAEAKWQQYSSILEKLGYEDILQKTRRLDFTHMPMIMLQMEDLGKGPLAEVATKEIKEAGLL